MTDAATPCLTCTDAGLEGVRRHLWDFPGTLDQDRVSAGRPGYPKTASMAALPRAPARGRKCAYFRSVNPGSECPSHRARETTDSPASYRPGRGVTISVSGQVQDLPLRRGRSPVMARPVRARRLTDEEGRTRIHR